MSGDLAGLRNLGPVTTGRLREVGIDMPEELRAVGAVEAYRRLRFAFPKDSSVIALMALEGALQDVDWRLLGAERVAELKAATEA